MSDDTVREDYAERRLFEHFCDYMDKYLPPGYEPAPDDNWEPGDPLLVIRESDGIWLEVEMEVTVRRHPTEAELAQMRAKFAPYMIAYRRAQLAGAMKQVAERKPS